MESKRIVKEINKQTTSVDYEAGSGVKKIIVSDTLSSLDVVGTYDNSVISSLKSVTVGNKVQQLAPSCFIGCRNLLKATLPDGCSDLGDYAFAGCSSLYDINCLNGQMASSLANIGSHCFDGCDGLVDVKINLGRSNRLTMIGEYAFANCKKLRSAEWTLAPFIASHMFAGCSSLTSLNFRNPTTNYVYPYGFADIPNLVSVQIPRCLWFLNDNMFEGCYSLSSVEIQDGVDPDTSSVMNQLGEWVFNKCSSLNSITLPRSITSFSQIDENFLAGSSISSVRFNGIDSSLFGSKQVISSNYQLGRWYTWNSSTKSSPKSLINFALKKKIPIVIVVTGSAGQSDWDKLNSQVLAKFVPDPDYFYMKVSGSAAQKLEDVVNALGDRYIRFTETGDTHACLYKYPRHKNHTFPHVLAIWSGKEGATAATQSGDKVDIVGIARMGDSAYRGFHVLKTGSKTKYDPKKGADKFLQWHKSYFSGFTPVATNYTMEAQGEMSLLGRNLGVPYQDRVMVRFYTSDGSYRDIYQNGTQVFEPEVRVDAFTRTNFKYGTWYYNASAVKQFADKYHIPVLIEYSSAGCDPCEYFKKQIYRDKTFQDWVSGMKCLFVRIEIKSGQKWDDPAAYPEPYFVDHEWVGEGSVSIPVFCWYWNRGNDQPPVKITRTYHFSPGEQEPPFSMQDLMLSTEQIFSEYVPLSDFNKVQVDPLFNDNLCVVMGRTYGNRPLGTELSASIVSSSLSDYYLDGLMDTSKDPYRKMYSQITSLTSVVTADGEYSMSSFWELTPNKIPEYVLSVISTDIYKGEFDSNGVYFPCDHKTEISGIDSYVTVKDPDGAIHVLSGGSIIGGQTLLDLNGNVVPDGTYQFYEFDSSNIYRYDQTGFIFKVEGGKTKYVYRFENDYGSSSGNEGVQKYSQRVLYGFDDSASGDDMQRFIDQCEEDGKKIPAIYFVGTGAGIPAVDSRELAAYMQTVNAYFAKVVSQSGNWAQDGTATRAFAAYLQEPRVRTRGRWKNNQAPGTSVPCMYVFKMCSSCFVSKDEIVPDLKAWASISGLTGA